jgi:hypothetical protein
MTMKMQMMFDTRIWTFFKKNFITTNVTFMFVVYCEETVILYWLSF